MVWRRLDAQLLLIGLGWHWRRRRLMSRSVIVLLLGILLGYLTATIMMVTGR